MKENKHRFGQSRNVLHWNHLYSLGSAIPSTNESLNNLVMSHVKSFKIYASYDKFSRRVTAMAWNPYEVNSVAVGSKGGDVILWNPEKDHENPSCFFEGMGPGGSIQSLVFDQRDNGKSIFCVSIDGTVTLKHFQESLSSCILSQPYPNMAWEYWYTSLAVPSRGDFLLVGSNKGTVTHLLSDGQQQWTKKLHKQKVTHLEFNPNDSRFFISTSVDKLLKVWDIRNIKDGNSSLSSHLHDTPINAAHFSLTDGNSVLTTDQHSQLRIYSCPNFSLKHSIYHPHRQFQHLTPIKAAWHPLRDIAVVGRYPDTKVDPVDIRSVDFFDGTTGHLLHQHFDSQAGKKIVSLNQFNKNGDKLLSAVGCSVVVWKPNFTHLKSKEAPNSVTNEKNLRRRRGRRIMEVDLSKLKKMSNFR